MGEEPNHTTARKLGQWSSTNHSILSGFHTTARKKKLIWEWLEFLDAGQCMGKTEGGRL
jgi:hypothetical protein